MDLGGTAQDNNCEVESPFALTTTARLDILTFHTVTHILCVMTKNITLAIDDDVLQEVRKYAADHNTTVNALVREQLCAIAARSKMSHAAWDELFRLADEAKAEIGPITWKRDDQYDR